MLCIDAHAYASDRAQGCIYLIFIITQLLYLSISLYSIFSNIPLQTSILQCQNIVHTGQFTSSVDRRRVDLRQIDQSD